MRRLLALFSFFTFIILLTGCGPVYETQYAYVPPKASMGKMCTSQCVQSKSMCEQMCKMTDDNCRSQARSSAMYEFEAYKNQRRAEGKPIKKDLGDFDRSFNCGSPCDCETTFNSCYTACGGQVLERKVCVAFCDKK